MAELDLASCRMPPLLSPQMRGAKARGVGTDWSLSAEIRALDLNYRRRMLEIEINEFAAAVADVVEGKQCRRAGKLIPRAEQQRAFHTWDRDIRVLMDCVTPSRNWKPVIRLRAASTRLLEWMDGTVFTPRAGGAVLASVGGSGEALTPRLGPLRERPKPTQSMSYYDDPLHDK